MPFRLRPYIDSDYAAVAEVYRDSVETLTRSAYGEEQVRMWASYPASGEDFRERLARGGVILAEAAREVAAFGQLEPLDHVAFLYCKGAFARRGLASEIYFGSKIGRVRQRFRKLERRLAGSAERSLNGKGLK
jgi:putative acetyltransferase